jgi:hypothetical protein
MKSGNRPQILSMIMTKKLSKMNQKILTESPSVYYNNALIKQPSISFNKVVRLVVDSRERNVNLFPNPASYEINLVEELNNVKSIKLIGAYIPFNTYTVNSNNNILYLAYNSQVYTIAINEGIYTESELASEITTMLNTETGTSAFTVTYNARKDKYKFQCTSAFGLYFKGQTFTHPYLNSTGVGYVDKSMGRILGFGIKDYASDGSNVIWSEFKKSFDLNECIIIKIDSFEVNRSTDDNVNNSFAILSSKNVEDCKDLGFIKEFKPVLGKLSKLKLRLIDYYGNLYDFQNQDHRLEFEVECEY